MDNQGQTALKIIILVGVLSVGLLLLLASGFRRSMEPREAERVTLGLDYSAFDADRAMEDIARMEEIGPRPGGSEALTELRDYLESEAQEAGLATQRYPFSGESDTEGEDNTPVNGVNLVAVVEGNRPGIILLGAHYDTKARSDIHFTGANQSASGAAWLLEMARTLGPQREGRTIWLTWFDGHETMNEAVTMPKLQGSAQFVEQLQASQQLDAIHAMIYVGQIGDCYLNISKDEGAPEWLWGLFEETAKRLKYQAHFNQRRQGFQGDFQSFREAGIPSLALVDFVYGGSILNHSKYWHTEEDRIDKLCGESLRAVGDVFVHALPSLESQLDQQLEGED